jgi:integrase
VPLHLALGGCGNPYSFSGFRTMLTKLLDKLEKDGKVEPGLTFHGLRHTAGKQLAEMALTRTTARLLGHKTLVMVALYSDQAEKKGRAAAAVRALGANEIRTKVSDLSNLGV